MPKEVDAKTKLRAKLEAMRIARTGIDNACDKLDEWKKIRRRLKKEGKDVRNLGIKIDVLEAEIDRIEYNAANQELSGCVDGGVGYGSGGGSGNDAG